MDFVWIYIESPSYNYKSGGVFNELDYSIRSVRKYFGHLGECYVVGDDPKLDVKHISVSRIETSKWGYYRHFDQIKKLKAVLDSEVSDDFVLMYDDLYLLQPLKMKDFDKIYAKSRINSLLEYFSQRKGDNSYRNCWLNTYKRILEFRDDIWDWETHLPRKLNKQKLKDLIDTYKLDRVDYLSYSLYAATHFGTPELITPDIQSNIVEYKPTKDDFDELFSAKFLNIADEGISGEFRRRMFDLFG